MYVLSRTRSVRSSWYLGVKTWGDHPPVEGRGLTRVSQPIERNRSCPSLPCPASGTPLCLPASVGQTTQKFPMANGSAASQ